MSVAREHENRGGSEDEERQKGERYRREECRTVAGAGSDEERIE